MNIYLDNNATTCVSAEVLAEMAPYWSHTYGNPSALYQFGTDVRKSLETSRERIAQCLKVKSERDIIFTSGATESNNTAIRSALKLFPQKKRIVISQVEHSSIKNLCDQLSKEGYEIISVGVSKSGALNLAQLERSLTDEVAIVSTMWVNNETGVIFPVEKIGALVKKKNILFHVDAVQAVGKMPVDFSRTGADYISVSAHKVHGPKGIGLLYVKSGSPFAPLMLGGRQERDRRAGTENVAAIIGFAKAIQLAVSDIDHNMLQIGRLRNRLEEGLLKSISDAFINGVIDERVSNTTNITIQGIESEAFLIRLSEAGIFVSSGSACLTGALEPSHVLMAMGHTESLALSSVRFSLSRYTTEDEIQYVIQTVPKLVNEMRQLSKRI